jgi:lysyl-tRNA synthetase class 2
MFLDIERDTQRLQVMVELKKLSAYDGVDEGFKAFKRVARIGDWICEWQNNFYLHPQLTKTAIKGKPTRTPSGQLTVLALQVPQILAPCLHHLPEKVDDAETLARRPHIHALTSDEPSDILRLRALIYDYIRTYFIQGGFLEVPLHGRSRRSQTSCQTRPSGSESHLS